MEELYRKLFQEFSSKGKRVFNRANVDVEAVWHSLELFESAKGRPLERAWSSTEPAVLMLMWSRAAGAWLEGWPRETGCTANEEPQEEFSSVPRESVESLGDGRYRWKKYLKEADNLDEAWKFFNDAWREEQERHRIIVERANRRKSSALQELEEDFASRIGPTTSLLHPGYEQQFFGRLFRDPATATFIEEGTWFKVTVKVGEGREGREEKVMCDLYDALRGDAEISWEGLIQELSAPAYTTCCLHLLRVM